MWEVHICKHLKLHGKSTFMSMLYDNEPFPPQDETSERLHIDPKIEEFMNSSVGRYLSDHPFIALTLLVFAVMATVPVGLFLGFGLVTLAATTMSIIFVEVFLLAVGGATLLCVLGCLAIFAVFFSFFLTACYITVSCIHKLYYGKRPSEKRKRFSRPKID
ncbi:lipid droplet assembly factor 1-like [Alosa sapidissima]|uniref:lipid droplet assembly factor 1-like n=1 Tax=Alosa sapidissima TaxID=34773 RepID=UPI001C083C84|nr:lipid droplet assembly factor 1-like [Alosa sapidissima]